MWNHSPEMLKRMRELELPFPDFSRKEMFALIASLFFVRYLGAPGDFYRGKTLVAKKLCLTCHSLGGKGEKIAPAFDKLAKYVSPLYMAQSRWNNGPAMDKEIEKKGLTRPQFERGEIVDLSAYTRSASKGAERERVFMSPGNPQRGKEVFKEKRCLNCHAINGEGSDIGPDLGESEWDYSVTEIAGLMWNHASAMGEFMEEEKIAWPELSGKEMADLIAYLYFIKFADRPGDPKGGKKLFSQKGCATCHGADAMSGDVGPDLSESDAISSTIRMAQILWNHAPVMEERIMEKAMPWPEFSGKEMTDLYAFLRSLQKK